MSKNSTSENISNLYNIISGVFDSEGYTLEEVMELKPEEREDVVDYEAINSKFDGLMSLESFSRRIAAYGVLQRFSLLDISRKIARAFLEYKQLPVYEAKPDSEEMQLSAIYSYALRRGIVGDLAHYVDRRQLLDKVMKRLDSNIGELQIRLREDAQAIELPASRSDAFRKASEKVAAGQKLIREYPQHHRSYVGRFLNQ